MLQERALGPQPAAGRAGSQLPWTSQKSAIPAEYTPLSSLSFLCSAPSKPGDAHPSLKLCAQQQGPCFLHRPPPGSCHGKGQWPDKHLRERPLPTCHPAGTSDKDSPLGGAAQSATSLPFYAVLSPCLSQDGRYSHPAHGWEVRNHGGGREKAVATLRSFIEQTDAKKKLESVTEMRRTCAIELSQTHCKYQQPPAPPPTPSQLILRFLLKK